MPDDFNPSQSEDESQTASSFASGAMNQAREGASDLYESASAQVRSLEEDCEEYIRENPTTAVFAALAVGFVVGLIIRK